MCLHCTLFSIVYLICSMTTFRKYVLTFDPTAGVEGICKDRICACPRVGRGTVGKMIATMIAAFVIPFNFDMEHDHVLKKLNIDHIPKK